MLIKCNLNTCIPLLGLYNILLYYIDFNGKNLNQSDCILFESFSNVTIVAWILSARD